MSRVASKLRRVRTSRRLTSCALVLISAATVGLPAGAAAELASEPASPAAGRVDVGRAHSCVVLPPGSVRCWGYGASGQLGYGNTDTIGDDETPRSVAPVSFGPGRTAAVIAAGDYHTCAILDDGTVRCWGYGRDGRLGYGNTNDIVTPSSVGPVDLGPGRTAGAISAGGAHTCAILDDGSVRCWGFGDDGRLGYGNHASIGDNETPASVGPVDLGTGHTARAISAGESHTCAILDDGSVRCWGIGFSGRLGYGNQISIGYNQTPGSVGPVDLGSGHTAQAISAGGRHTCAILDDGTVRCWGDGGHGQLGYGNTNNLGDTPATTPDKLRPVDLGPGRTVIAISAGALHTCAVLDDGTVRCWGFGALGQLGYGNIKNAGDTPATTPDKLGPVYLGPGRTAIAISAGDRHTCALLDNGRVRCWGDGANGRLGYCNQSNIGDTPDTTPGRVGPVNLLPGDGGALCANTRGGGVDPLRVQAQRAQGLHRCLAKAARRARHQRNRARTDCLKRYGRTPGRVRGLQPRVTSSTKLLLTFAAPGSDGSRPPAARAYLVRQSRRPIRSGRDFLGAPTLCNGSCQFNVTVVGTKIKLMITHLAPHHTYYYAIAARDNVTGKLGPRSAMVQVRTR